MDWIPALGARGQLGLGSRARQPQGRSDCSLRSPSDRLKVQTPGPLLGTELGIRTSSKWSSTVFRVQTLSAGFRVTLNLSRLRPCFLNCEMGTNSSARLPGRGAQCPPTPAPGGLGHFEKQHLPESWVLCQVLRALRGTSPVTPGHQAQKVVIR